MVLAERNGLRALSATTVCTDTVTKYNALFCFGSKDVWYQPQQDWSLFDTAAHKVTALRHLCNLASLECSLTGLLDEVQSEV